MVTEKEETSAKCMSPKANKQGKNSQTCFNLSSSLSVKLIPSLNEEEDRFKETNESVGEVVLSLRCKACSFLCPDKSTLLAHVKEAHGVGDRSENKANVDEINATASTNTNGSGSVTNESRDERSASNNVQTEKSEKRLYSVIGVPHSEEEEEDMFLCAECDIVFPTEELCCRHMSQVHNIKHFSAQFIREEIISKSSVAEDKPKRRQVRPPKQYTAEGGAVVPKKFRVTKDTFFSCSKCNVKFESSEVTKFHEQCHVKPINGNEKGFSCPVCVSQKPAELSVTEIFPIWGKISMHLWKEHKIDCELHCCSVCKQYKNHLITKVKDHEKLHYPDANYKCTTCNKSFKQYKQLKTHEKYHKETNTKLPPPQDSRWYTPKECQICKRILADSKCLKKHISAVHNKLKPYGCHICGHTTARKAELQLHIRQHTGEKPYKCPYCSFATGDHNSLRNHKMRHSDTRPYMCPYCDYRCIQSAPFKKHILAVHPGQEVVYLCQLCNHASVNDILFAAHQKDHENDREACTSDSSSSTRTNNDGNTNENKTSAKARVDSSKPNRYWLDDEEDSVEMVVDTGGITIPAPESEISTPEIQILETAGTVREVPQATGNKMGIGRTEKPNATNGSFSVETLTTISQSPTLPTMTLCIVNRGPPLEIFDNDESANQCPASLENANPPENSAAVNRENMDGIQKAVSIVSNDSPLIETSTMNSSLPTMTLSLSKSGPSLEIFDADESANQCPSGSPEGLCSSSDEIISLFPTTTITKNIISRHANKVSSETLVTAIASTANPGAPFLEPLDLSDIICNDHSNDETLERLLGIN